MLAALVVAAVWLVHSPIIDRLEVTKLAAALVLASLAFGAATIVALRARVRDHATTSELDDSTEPASRSGRRSSSLHGLRTLGLFGLGLLAVSLLAPRFTAARVEAWAPWVTAGLVFALARGARPRHVGLVLGAAATLLAAIGLAQGLGADWMVGDVHAFRGRPILGTLGNPSLFGVCLAGALPFVVDSGSRARGVVAIASMVSALVIVAAIFLSGSRTAWVMLAPTAVLVAADSRARRLWWRPIAAALLGVGLAALVGLASPHVELESRISDVTDPRGTAAGRFYLWRVHAQLLIDAGPLGGGPGAFQRRWPGAQADYLADHPTDVGFHSDLRHAHADAIEMATDFGWSGLLVAAWALWWLLRPRSRAAAPEPVGRAALASFASLLVGGLAMPVLFQTPTLLLAALAAGLLAPPRRSESASGAWLVAAALGLGLTLYWAGQRTLSEAVRSEGLQAEIRGRVDEARVSYLRAAELDPTNPLAQWMVARSQLDTDAELALEAASAAARELPIAPIYALRGVAAEAADRPGLAAESWATFRWLRPSDDE